MADVQNVEHTSKEVSKNKLCVFLSNKYNLIFIAILIFAFSIRLYYFFLTKNQPFWWDEAEYGNLAKQFIGQGVEGGWWAGRPILFSLIWAGVLKLGASETTIRLLQTLLSTTSVYLLYLVAKELTNNKKVALFSSFLLSVFWLHLFYTERLLTEIPALVFLLAGAYFFLKMLNEAKLHQAGLAGAFFAASFLSRFPLILAVLAFVIFGLLSKRIAFLKAKTSWLALSAFAATVVPFFIWAIITFGDPLAPIKVGSEGAGGLTLGLPQLKTYVSWLPHYFTIPLLIISIISLVLLVLNVFLNHKAILAEEKEFLLILLWLMLPFLFFCAQASAAEDRYLMPIFPAVFILVGITLDRLYVMLASRSRFVAILVVGILLLFSGAFQLQHANDIISWKLHSFQEVKDASLWAKQNLRVDEAIFTSSGPQVTYYAERKTYSWPTNESVLKAEAQAKSIKLMVISIFESHPDWVYTYPEKYNLTLAKAYQSDGKPVLLVYLL